MVVSRGLLEKLEAIYAPLYTGEFQDQHEKFKDSLNTIFKGSDIDRNDAKTIYYVAVYNLNTSKDCQQFSLDDRVSDIFLKLL